ncbi:FAD/NAD(P)-binding domain-containing protein [Daedaleopsis nitida]|nr:FAD/NAD(P)-binding domain-containing protein [Daedaleopsis nitida]
MPDGSSSKGSRAEVPADNSEQGVPQPFKLGDFAIDEYRPIKVIVIGAGYSGILAGIRFPQKISNLDLTIYEQGAGVGGTWYNNKFPGIACDVPAHCYQYSFEDKGDWSSFCAPGHEIQQNLQDIVDRYKLMRYIRLKHEMIHAAYDEPTGKWHLRICNPEREFEDTADVLVTAFGVLTRWKLPDIEGIESYKGELHHTAGYDPGERTWMEAAEEWKDKRVGVIGVGATALQVVSALQPRVAKIVNYVRGQTWLSPAFANNPVVSKMLGRSPEASAKDELGTFSPEEIERFKDKEFYREFRRALENEINSMHSYTQTGSELQIALEELCRTHMATKLAQRPDIAERLIPKFPISCRRLTFGPGYLDAVIADNAEYISSPVKRFTETGIETEDGEHKELDLVFCATGYDASWQLPFKIIGRSGVDLNEKWKPHPTSYLTMCVDGFPNMFMCSGPNSFLGAGMLMPVIEHAVSYAVQATAKMQRERLKSMEVKPEAVKAFDEYIDSYFPKTVFSAKCRSWYKLDKEEGRVVGLWPGSGLHALRALRHPRWEDYNYERENDENNLLYWLGDGQTWNEKTLTGDRAWYLSEEFIDRPPIPVD